MRLETAMFGRMTFAVRTTQFFIIIIETLPGFVWPGRSWLELYRICEERISDGNVATVSAKEICTLLAVYRLWRHVERVKVTVAFLLGCMICRLCARITIAFYTCTPITGKCSACTCRVAIERNEAICRSIFREFFKVRFSMVQQHSFQDVFEHYGLESRHRWNGDKCFSAKTEQEWTLALLFGCRHNKEAAAIYRQNCNVCHNNVFGVP